MVEDIDNLVDGATYLDGLPFSLWQWMREYEPVAWHEPAAFPGFWSVTRYDDVKAILRDPEHFRSSAGIVLRPSAQGADPGGNRTFALSDPPRHTVIREAVAAWFAPRHLNILQAGLDVAAHRIVKKAVEAGTIDFVADVAAQLPVDLICAFLDLPAADRPAVAGWTNQAFCAGTARERSVAHAKILGYFAELAAERRAEPGDDLVSALASLEVDGELMSLDEVVLNCDNLLVGGTENVRLATASGMLALLEHPEQWELLRRRFDAVESTAVDEILRWTSSATHMMRKSIADTRVGDRQIREGDLVVCWLPSANRDHRQFGDPDVFDIRRSPNRHLALGAGPHFCVGSRLVRLELRTILREICAQVGSVQYAGIPERLDSIVVNGLRSLPLTLQPNE